MANDMIGARPAWLDEAEWLFFDLGDTLLDEADAIRERIDRICGVCARQGRPLSPESLREALDKAIAACARHPIPHAVAALAGGAEKAARILADAPPPVERMRPFSGATELLRALAQRYRLGVIANQSPGTEARLAGYGWDGLFACVVASAEEGLEKPDPAIFRLALERAGCAPGRAVMIGDRPDNDIAPAKRLGWRTIRVRQGLHAPQAPRCEDEEADLVVCDLAGLAALLGLRP